MRIRIAYVTKNEIYKSISCNVEDVDGALKKLSEQVTEENINDLLNLGNITCLSDNVLESLSFSEDHKMPLVNYGRKDFINYCQHTEITMALILNKTWKKFSLVK